MNQRTVSPLGFGERFGVSRESLSHLETYVGLLVTWQKHINLVAESTLPLVWERHVADSLQLIKLIPKDTHIIADLGSGGGLPGIVLACVGSWQVHFYESNAKKAAFLQECLRQLRLVNTVHRIRLEKVGKSELPVATVVTARALAPMPVLLGLAEPWLMRGATALFHKGEDVDEELKDANKTWKIRYIKHPSMTDSKAVILEVQELRRVS